MIGRSVWLSLILVTGLLIASGRAATVTLYDGSSDIAAGPQWLYLTNPLFGSHATHAAVLGGTELDSTAVRGEYAGVFTHNPIGGVQVHPLALVLDRSVGYTISFDLQMLSEGHDFDDRNGDGKPDRAGFSVIAISGDRQGLELAFFQDRIWAYEDDTPLPVPPPIPPTMFTQAEGVAWTTTDPTTYHLTILGDGYELSAGSSLLLSGPLRDYTSFTGLADPYDVPNMLFFGDDTGSADSRVKLGAISVTPVPEPAGWVLLLIGAAALLVCRRRRSCSSTVPRPSSSAPVKNMPGSP